VDQKASNWLKRINIAHILYSGLLKYREDWDFVKATRLESVTDYVIKLMLVLSNTNGICQ